MATSIVAWLALVGVVIAGVLLVRAHRRIGHLERSHTDRKWDVVVLRAELRTARGAGDGPPDVPIQVDRSAGAAPGEAHARPIVPPGRGERSAGGGSEGERSDRSGGDRVPADIPAQRSAAGRPGTSATAWRRSHRHPDGARRRPR